MKGATIDHRQVRHRDGGGPARAGRRRLGDEQDISLARLKKKKGGIDRDGGPRMLTVL
ncbi:hypothetical protein LGM65_23085 [Burkholderia anthina]|uniref:hypothetical protein n=1 Tax=Burkholderia anthina TaxID=179879 RepID=UPI001CF167C3|nr:hypothetical protein [Burkholderia anthina]MCA8093736.1 hypothetical protein [Burkholderia anthina]